MKTDFIIDFRNMFLVNYKDNQMRLIEAVLVSFLLLTLNKFLFPGVFSNIGFT